MPRTKTKNLTIFDRLEKKENIDYSEYSVKQLSEAIVDIYTKYDEERNRKISSTKLDSVKKLAAKLSASIEQLVINKKDCKESKSEN